MTLNSGCISMDCSWQLAKILIQKHDLGVLEEEAHNKETQYFHDANMNESSCPLLFFLNLGFIF